MFEQQKQKAGSEEKNIHLDGDGQTVDQTAGQPATIKTQIDGHVQQQHGDRVVEQPKHVDGVDAVGSAAHEQEGERRDGLDSMQDANDQGQVDQVDDGEHVLSSQNVRTPVGQLVEQGVDVKMAGRVNYRSGVARNLAVIQGTVEKTLYLLHVR